MSDMILIGSDLQISQSGDIACSNNDYDVIQQANNTIITILKSNPFHIDIGNKVFLDRMKFTDTYLDIIQSCSIDAILKCDNRVESVDELNVELSNTYGIVNISYKLILYDGNELHSDCIMNIL